MVGVPGQKEDLCGESKEVTREYHVTGWRSGRGEHVWGLLSHGGGLGLYCGGKGKPRGF